MTRARTTSKPMSPAAGWMCLAIIFVLGVMGVSCGGFPGLTGAPELNTGDTAWILTASALVLLMTPGLSFFYGGMVHRKNVLSTMIQSFASMGVISLLWIVVGFSLAFGDSVGGVIGNPMTFFMFKNVGGAPNPAFSATIPFALFALFQLKFAIITPALITGAFAERIRFSNYLLFMVLFSIFIYCPLAHMTWHPDGLLRKAGVLDFAGGTVVHMSAGLAALAGALYVGRRDSHMKAKEHVPENIPYVMLGTGLLWFGWFGFNAGSALGANASAVLAFLTTNTASAAALVTWMFLDIARGRKPSALGACVGAVVGLVAITPGAGFVSIGSSLLIGAIASTVSYFAVVARVRSNLDDTLDVFPCHGVGGMVGMIATALFAMDGGLFTTGQTKLTIAHFAALIGVAVFSFGASWILYMVTNAVTPARVDTQGEIEGLDLNQHGERA